MSANVEIVKLTKKKLASSIDTDDLWQGDTAIFPKSKAFWLVSNEAIADEDYVGLLLYEGKELVSFIYMMPTLVKLQGENLKKVYWFLHWWVTPRYENTVMSTYTFNEAVNMVNGQVLIKSYAEKVNHFYEKQPFELIKLRERHTIFMGVEPSVVVQQIPKLKLLKPVISVVNQFVYHILRMVNASKIEKYAKQLSYEYPIKIDAKTTTFINKHIQSDLTYKSEAYINWQISPEQYTSIGIPSKYKREYLQTGASTAISIKNITVIKDHQIIGFISFVQNKTESNIKYFLAEKEHYVLCVSALLEHVYKYRIQYIFTDNNELQQAITSNFRVFYTYKQEKRALKHKKLIENLDHLDIKDQDGHFY